MHPAVKEYTKGVEMPPDPLAVDLAVTRRDSVYSVLPFTVAGYAFVVDHQELGVIDATEDALLVPVAGIVSFLDRVFDEGLKVV